MKQKKEEEEEEGGISSSNEMKNAKFSVDTQKRRRGDESSYRTYKQTRKKKTASIWIMSLYLLMDIAHTVPFAN